MAEDRRKRVRAGIDIGGTNVKIGLVDGTGRLAASVSVPTRGERRAAEVLGEVGRQVLALLDSRGLRPEECLGAGVGVPGTVDREAGVVLYSNNLCWENVPLAELLRLPMPVRAANDADCAALGEAVAGAGKGRRRVVLITLGTGVGGGVILDGRILSGSELGHMVIIENGEPCTCGRRGCLEAYASATALKRDGARAAGRPVEPEEVFAAAAAGDPRMTEVVDAYLRRLGTGVVNIVNLFRPQAVLLGGGLSRQGETLLAPLRAMVREQCFGGARGGLPEIGEALLGNRAGMIGAASLIGADIPGGA